MRKLLFNSGGRNSVAPERVLRDWALANGGDGPPRVEPLAIAGAELAVERLVWPTLVNPVQMYRIKGGGHGWPGGPQYLPGWVIGRIPKSFDATGVILDYARSLVQVI